MRVLFFLAAGGLLLPSGTAWADKYLTHDGQPILQTSVDALLLSNNAQPPSWSTKAYTDKKDLNKTQGQGYLPDKTTRDRYLNPIERKARQAQAPGWAKKSH